MRRLAWTAVLAITVVSCSESSTSPVSDLDAIDVKVKAQPSTIVAGAPTNVILTLSNTSARAVEVSACPIYFWVEMRTALPEPGPIVGGSKSMGCVAAFLIYQPLVFKPFETKTMTFEWRETAVPAGTYFVVGWVNDPAHDSPAAAVRVLPAN